MLKYGLVPVLVGFSSSLLANSLPSEILDYNHVYASAGSGSLNEDAGGNNNASIFSLGLSHEMTDEWLILGDYAARFVHPNESTTRTDTLMGGVGYKYRIDQDFDFVASYLLGVTKSKAELNESNVTLSSETEFIHGAKIALNYGFSRAWIANGSIQFNRSDLFDEEVYHAGLRYLVTPKFAVGGFYNHRNGSENRTNELGVNFLLEY